MRAETGNCGWKNIPQDKTERLLNLLGNWEALHHLESFTDDETVSFIPKCSGMRREKLGAMLWHLFAGVRNGLLLAVFSVFNIVTNTSCIVRLLIRHLPWKTKIQGNMALRKCSLMKQNRVIFQIQTTCFLGTAKNAEMVLKQTPVPMCKSGRKFIHPACNLRLCTLLNLETAFLSSCYLEVAQRNGI